nr:reverse transcriptase domain-containing protein [Tanacetum cinerariifolium]
ECPLNTPSILLDHSFPSHLNRWIMMRVCTWIASVRAELFDMIITLERDNLKLEGMLCVERKRVDRLLRSRSKARVAVDALSRNERAKPFRVRALVMTINLNLLPQIHEARVEALKKENVKDENYHGMDKEIENRLDGTLCIKRSWLPRVRDLGELIKHESHKPSYFIHPGIK